MEKNQAILVRFQGIFLKLKIGQRLKIAFTLINLIFLAVAVVAIVGLLSQKSSLGVLQFNQEQSNYSKQILGLVQVQQQGLFDSLQAINDEEKKAASQKLSGALEQLQKISEAQKQALKNVSRSDEEAGMFAELDGKMAIYNEKIGEFAKLLIDPNQRSDVFADAQEQATKLAEEMVSALNKLDKLQSDESMQQMNSISNSATLILSVVVIFTLSALAFSYLLGTLATRSITRPLNEAVLVAEQVASGDLTAHVESRASDETGQLLQALGKMVDNLSSTVRLVNGASSRVHAMAREMSQSSHEVLTASRQQSDAAASTAASVEEVTVSITTIADTAEEVRQLAQESHSATRQGAKDLATLVNEVASVQTAVQEIATSVNQFISNMRAISTMAGQVKDIAEQTNLLALNAAIEAARAGEQGRGFAVVADEVRKLAEKSSTSAKEIDKVTQEISSQSSQVENAVSKGLHSLDKSMDVVRSVETSLNTAANAVENTNTGMSDIAISVKEQREANNAIARNIEQVAQMAEENTAIIQNTAANVSEVVDAAEQLNAAVSHFKV
jgi:methyl-accepting chemotaxis protein